MKVPGDYQINCDLCAAIIWNSQARIVAITINSTATKGSKVFKVCDIECECETVGLLKAAADYIIKVEQIGITQSQLFYQWK